jgi:PBSX family phage portal protein
MAENNISFVDANASSNKATHRALRTVHAKVIEVNGQKATVVEITKASGLTDGKADPGESQILPDEVWSSLTQAGRVIEPPFDMLTLAMLAEHNSELGQCLEAMETNIDGYGHRFISRLMKDDTQETAPGADVSEKEPETPSPDELAAQAEFAMLTNFFTYCTEESFVNFRSRLRRDKESTGNCYFEIQRDADGRISGFFHCPAHQIRLGRVDDDAILVDRKIAEMQPDGSMKIKTQKEWRRFRRFVQSRAIYRRQLSTMESAKVRWFKEFGDTRRLHKETGEYEAPNRPVPDNMLASEMIHEKLYSARSPYGLPRFIGNLLSIFGDRASEEVNYITFRNNNIPSMVVCVSNGQLTPGTIARMESFVESQIQGSDNYSKFLIVEAEPFGDEGEDGGQVKIDIKPLTANQHKDALFQDYSKNNQDKIRRAFRLPPIFVGRSDDYSKSTAESSRRLADEQVFAPQRDEFDAIFNRRIFPEMGIVYHKYKSATPNTTDNQLLVKMLAAAEKTGGITPRIARNVMQSILTEELPDFPANFPADVPYSMTMAQAVKNMADPAEPGQQITALKALGIMFGDDNLDLGIDDETDEVTIAKKLMGLQKSVEALWRSQQSDE